MKGKLIEIIAGSKSMITSILIMAPLAKKYKLLIQFPS